MGVSKNRGTTKWMVYNGKPYFLMDDLGVFPLFLETSIYRIVTKMNTDDLWKGTIGFRIFPAVSPV